MKLSRRRLLQGAVAAAGVLAAGGGAWWLRADLHGRARRLYHRLTNPPMPPSPPGALDDDTARTLRAAAEALVGEAGRDERYAAPFRWRAAHLPGYLELYRRFSGFVDAGGPRFVSLSAAERRRLLSRRFPGGRLRHLLTGWTAPERMRMRRQVIEEILAVYAASDVWTDLGYETWPGTVRGLDAYREPPPGARTAR